MFENLPKVKVGIVAVSRDCFPESLSVDRRKAHTEKTISMSARSASWKVRFIWFRRWRT